MGRKLLDHIPLKQGLRQIQIELESSFYSLLLDHIPLKQGLRQIDLANSHRMSMTLRPYSIKTRIKTHVPHICSLVQTPLRPYSIKTRIKTPHQHRFFLCNTSLRPYSIKTRIKTACRFPVVEAIFLLDHIPLKQGLRRYQTSASNPALHPLRPYSIKTRIKTFRRSFALSILRLS